MKQTDWSGGYGQQVWSDNTKFNEFSHVKYQTKGELAIDNANDNRDNWYDTKWKYRRQIKFNNQENGELSHFPILVKLVHKDNFNYDKVHSQGNDIRFTDSDGTTILPHDIDKWEETGTSYIWVKVPNIKASSSDDYIYMYYGNPEAADTRNPAGVFDGNFVTVHHLNQNPTNNGTYADATNKGITGTLIDTNNTSKSGVEGKIGSAHQFDGPTGAAYIDLGDDARTDFGTSTDFTLEGWINITGPNSHRQSVLEKRNTTVGYTFHYHNTPKALRAVIGNSSGGNCVIDAITDITLKPGWHYMAATFYRRASCTVNDILIYLDGKREQTSVNTSSANTNTDTDSTNSLLFGRQGSQANYFKGSMDELRISNTARDPAYVKASYETVEGTLQTYGNEETLGGELLSSIFDSGHGNNWGYLSYTANEPEKTAARVKIRTGNNMYLADAPDFEVCDSIVNKTDISNNNCVTDGHRYIQYQVILDTTEAGKTPVFKNISITDFLPSNVKLVVEGISTQPQVTSHKEQENIKPQPTAQAGLRPSASPNLITNPYPLTTIFSPLINFFEALFH